MEKLVLFSALLVTLLFELCSAAGAHQPSGVRKQQKTEDLRSIPDLNEGQYAPNLETIMQLLAERDAQEAEWRRNEAMERENLLAELSAQKRGFNYYGARGKKSGFEQQKRFNFNYLPSRGK